MKLSNSLIRIRRNKAIIVVRHQHFLFAFQRPAVAVNVTQQALYFVEVVSTGGNKVRCIIGYGGGSTHTTLT